MKTENYRIVVLSPYCLLRPTTNRIFDMRMCDGFAGHGQQVEIVYPYTYLKENIKAAAIPASYGLQHQVKTRMLWTPLREYSSKAWRFVTMFIAFSWHAFLLFIRSLFPGKPVLIFSRDAKSLLPYLLFRKIFRPFCSWTLVFMAAEVKRNTLFKLVAKEADIIFAGVSSIQKALQEVVKLPDDKFILAYAPVPVFRNDVEKAEARKRIAYTGSESLVVYTGKLGLDVMEVRMILEAAALVPEVKFLFTGGRASVIEKIKSYCQERNLENILLTGFFDDSTRVRNYQLAADVLISYYTSKDHMVEFNYPQKINEYLSTGNPVITPDFSATRDVLNENNVFFVEPDNPPALAKGIRQLLADPALMKKLGQQAKADSVKLSFESRTSELLDFIRKYRKKG